MTVCNNINMILNILVVSMYSEYYIPYKIKMSLQNNEQCISCILSITFHGGYVCALLIVLTMYSSVYCLERGILCNNF